MEKRIPKISISKLLILSNCLIMTAFFSISYFYSQKSYQDIMERELKDKQYQMLLYISDTLNEQMKAVERLARSAVNNYNIINKLLQYNEYKNSYGQYVFQNNMNQNLSALAYNMQDIVSVNILMDEPSLKTTKTNAVYYYENYGEHADSIRDMTSGWITTRENDFAIETYVTHINTYVMRIYAGLYSGEGIGHLVINVNEKLFYDQIKEYSWDEEADILFVDETGNIISSTDRSVIGMPIAQTEYEKYRQVLEGEAKEDRNTRNMIMNKKELEERRYYVMAVADYDKTVASFKNAQKMILMYSLALLLVFAAFSANLAYWISKPILLLSKAVADFKGEVWTYQADRGSYIYEIDVLCKGFEQMTVQMDQLIKSLVQQEKQKKKKELEILQAQINPHFLYNTLETINWMALSMKQKEISNMVILLGKFLRLSLNKGKDLYFVRDELNHLKCYMEIQNIRHGGRIEFSVEGDESVLECKMVKLLLQPVVENSILHGFDFRSGAGQIWVKVLGEEPYIYFTVTDDGCGMDKELAEKICDMSSEAGYGIKNVIKRIQLYYGDEGSLSIRSTPQVGTTVEIRILKEVSNHQ